MDNSKINERPILFSAPMVRAILDGSKTQTRRIIKPQPGADIERCANIALMPPKPDGATHELRWMPGMFAVKRCPYGYPGDRLWVRETWAWSEYATHHEEVLWRADREYTLEERGGYKWRPSIHMPRWASRITLEITGVRVERLKEISEVDAAAEGVIQQDIGERLRTTAWCEFRNLWDGTYGEASWDLNPWVWVIEFSRLSREITA